MRVIIAEDHTLTFESLSNALKAQFPEIEISHIQSLCGINSALLKFFTEKCIWIVSGELPNFDDSPTTIRIHGPEAIRHITYYRKMCELIIGYTSVPTIFTDMDEKTKPQYIVVKNEHSIGEVVRIVQEYIKSLLSGE